MSEDPKDEDGAPDAGDSEAEAEAQDKRRVRKRDAAARPLEEDNPGPAQPKVNYLFLVVTSFLFLVADLASKEWAATRLAGPGAKIDVIPGYFAFDLAKNKGGAWGIFGNQPDYVRLPFFFLISIVAVVFIVSLYKKLEPRQVALKWALPLVLGGALGNLADRIRHQHVIDFVDWYYVTPPGTSPTDFHHWPTFNIADVWIVAGVILMGIDMFTPRHKLPRRAPAALRRREAAAKKPATPSGEEA